MSPNAQLEHFKQLQQLKARVGHLEDEVRAIWRNLGNEKPDPIGANDPNRTRHGLGPQKSPTIGQAIDSCIDALEIYADEECWENGGPGVESRPRISP